MLSNSICITDARFADRPSLPVFHREAEAPNSPDPTECANAHVLFRKKFTLLSAQNCVLRISADDYYKLYVNGRFVTQGPAPGYNTSYYYSEVSLDGFVTAGENTIAVHTYYQGLVNRVWVSGDMRHMLAAELLQNGECILATDETWKTAPHTGFSALHTVGYKTAFAEKYDSRAPEAGFAAPDFDDSSWSFACRRTTADYTFLKQPTKQLEISSLAPAAIHRHGNVISVDFGREIVGMLRLCAKGTRGDTIILRSGEERNEDGGVRYELRCNCKYEEEWVLSGGDDTLEPFDFKGFRYADILVPYGCRIADGDITATVRHYPFHEVLDFPLTHPRYAAKRKDLERIWRLCADTIQYGVQEVYMDCPTREKGQYSGDVSIMAPAHILLTGDGSMMKKALYEYARSSFIAEGMMTVAPASFMQEIADYSMQYPMQLLSYYTLTGDLDTLRELEPYATRSTEYFTRFAREDGLVESVETWNLVDWPQNLRDGYDFSCDKPTPAGVHNVINAFYYGMLADMNRIYKTVGIDRRFDTERVAKSYVRAFYRPALSLFADTEASNHTAIHSQLLPLFMGLDKAAPEGTRQAILSVIRERGLVTGVYMAYFLLEALVRAGEYDTAVDLMTSEGAWLLMLSEGATATFEAWSKEQKWNTSLFHPWATAPILIVKEIADALNEGEK